MDIDQSTPDQNILPTVALAPGDCTGIGPEQTAKILADGNLADVARLVVVGDPRVLEMAISQAGVPLEVARNPSPARLLAAGRVPLAIANTDLLFPLGRPTPSPDTTGEMLSRDRFRGRPGRRHHLAPLNKRAMFDGGWKFRTSTRCSRACSA
jgi:4-hydroxythreonine-4-phosphate dehydrogenase